MDAGKTRALRDNTILIKKTPSKFRDFSFSIQDLFKKIYSRVWSSGLEPESSASQQITLQELDLM